ncbi:MAG: hypothetical protein H3C51_03945 [Rubellimicrobium sp.]|nr:hypothetical protein [Rubellimicrobium sp.]
MTNPPAAEPPPGHARRAIDIAQRLDHARTRIEARFLEGGHVLGAALESTATLRDLLTQVLAALDENAVASTVTDLDATAQRLLELPGRQADRHRRMGALAAGARRLRTLIDDMRATLRYLRTVAITVRIAGADAGGFGEFAGRMLALIEEGRSRIDGFAARLDLLLAESGAAGALHRSLQADHARSLPALTQALARDARGMQDYHAAIRRLAATQADLAREIADQVARTLMALQIGDMTRQRIEHVASGLVMLAETAPALSRADQALVSGFLARQLADLTEEFHHGSGAVARNLAALAASMVRMLALGRQAGAGDDRDDFLPAMERGVLAAHAIVTRIEKAGLRAAAFADHAAAITHELGDAVGAITKIRADIQFMAINTSLRCRRLGDAGRAVVVVATELRNFAAGLESVAGRILSELAGLDTLAAALMDDSTTGTAGASPGSALEAVLDRVRASHRRMQHDLQALAAQGEDLASDLGHGIARLDFTKDLGDTLDAATRDLAPGNDIAATHVAAAPTVALLARIRASYTMARERRLHDDFFAGDFTGDALPPADTAARRRAPATTATTGDDLAAILF